MRQTDKDIIASITLSLSIKKDTKEAIQTYYNKVYISCYNEASSMLTKNKKVYETKEEYNKAISNLTITLVKQRFGLIFLKAIGVQI